MRVFRASDSIPTDARGASIALGNFDGVHRGHQAVMASARVAAEQLGAPLGMAVFEPHPRRFFFPGAPPFALQSFDQRARAAALVGVSVVYEIAFTAELASWSAEDFAQLLLVEQIGVRHVSVGDDFRFGKNRAAGVEELAQIGAALGFSVTAVSQIEALGDRISSTAIRDALAVGDIGLANTLLTRPWAIEGVVERGFQRGRGFGFATANLKLGEYTRPKLGIYAVRVNVGDGVWRAGVASIGVNPTVGALPEPLLEAHLFDFDADLYGKTIEVQLHAYLRAEAKFDDVDALKAQMARDAEAARKILNA